MQYQIIYLLFVFNFIDKICSMTLEEMIRESVARGLKSLTQLKRELPEDGMDEDSGELISAAEKDEGIKYEESTAIPVRREILQEKAKLKTEIKNCSCKHHHQKEQQGQDKLKTSRYLGTHDEFIENARKHLSTNTNPTPTETTSPKATSRSSSTTDSNSKGQLNDSNLELQELELQLEDTIKEGCSHYKRIPELDMDSMVDVWQLAYYKALEGLTCFKIFIKKTSPQSRKRYKIKYTSFNETIDWKECQLELCSTGRRLNNMRHFLQGSKTDKGVLENIVLLASTQDDKKIITLLDQAPDQWMVTKNLLLMRDCESGDVVIFTRVLSKPDKKELVDAMNTFGENGMDSTMPCRPQNDDGVKKESDMMHMKYYSNLS